MSLKKVHRAKTRRTILFHSRIRPVVRRNRANYFRNSWEMPDRAPMTAGRLVWATVGGHPVPVPKTESLPIESDNERPSGNRLALVSYGYGNDIIAV